MERYGKGRIKECWGGGRAEERRGDIRKGEKYKLEKKKVRKNEVDGASERKEWE